MTVNDAARNIDHEQEIDDYPMISELFNFDQLKVQEDFGIKRYRDSLYKG